MKDFFFGPISPALFREAFLTGTINYDTAVSMIKERIFGVRKKAEESEEENEEQGKGKRKKKDAGKGKKSKKPKLEAESKTGPKPSEKDMCRAIVGNAPISSLLPPVTHLYPNKLAYLSQACPSLDFVDTSTHEDKNCVVNSHHCKPDIAAYNKNVVKRGITDFSRIEVALEVKHDKSFDPFVDAPPLDGSPVEDGNTRVESNTTGGIDTMGQVATYAAAQMAQQLRPWVFSVVICGDRVRFLRWDRSGAIFTSHFDYETTDHLKEFFYQVWRIGCKI